MEKKRSVPGRNDKIRLMAHRGFTPMAPQNSIAAFLEAGRRGFWGIETDVRMTADGHLVCVHDATVDSLYLGSGAVFGSATKLNAKPMTKELLNAICHAVQIPVVAIGGINRQNILELAGTDISGVAVVSGIFAADDIAAECRHLRSIVQQITK